MLTWNEGRKNIERAFGDGRTCLNLKAQIENLELTRIRFYPLLDHFALRGNGQARNGTPLEFQRDGYSPMSPNLMKKLVVTFVFY